jgi:hypothetical protein
MINEQELIKLGFEWDEEHIAWTIQVSHFDNDFALKQKNILLVQMDYVWILADWIGQQYLILLGKLDLKDLKGLVEILKRAL